jgi:outer membrane protein TolC
MFMMLRLRLLSTALSLLPLPVAAEEMAQRMKCEQVPLSSSLATTTQLPQFRFCSPVSGMQQSSDLETQSAHSLLDDVVTQNPSVQSYALQVKSSEYGLKSANGAWWPNVSMSNSSVLFTDILSSQNYGGSPATPSSPATSGTAFNPFNGSTPRDRFRGRSNGQLTSWTESYSNYTQAYPVIQIQWNFLNPSRYPQIAAAKHQLALSQSQLRQASQQTRSAILLAYGEYLFAGFQIAEVLRLLEIQTSIVQQARERVNLKLLPRFQADQQFRSLLSYQTQLQSLQIQQSNAAVKLESLLTPLAEVNGQQLQAASAAFSPISLHDVLSPRLQSWPWERGETVERSLAYSENLKQLMLQSAIATDNANEQWGAILPTIGLLGYVTYQYTAGSQNYAPPTQPSGAASSTLSNYAGLSISWNLFDGYATRNQAKSYEQTAASYKAQYRDAATQLKAQILENLNQLEGSEQLIDLSLQDLKSAEQIALDTKARAGVGLAQLYDVLNADMDVYQSRSQLVQALASYVKTFGQLSALVGSLDDSTYEDKKAIRP